MLTHTILGGGENLAVLLHGVGPTGASDFLHRAGRRWLNGLDRFSLLLVDLPMKQIEESETASKQVADEIVDLVGGHDNLHLVG